MPGRAPACLGFLEHDHWLAAGAIRPWWLPSAVASRPRPGLGSAAAIPGCLQLPDGAQKPVSRDSGARRNGSQSQQVRAAETRPFIQVTRERQSCHAETANSGRKARDQRTAALTAPPQGGVGRLLCPVPLGGGLRAALVRRPLLFAHTPPVPLSVPSFHPRWDVPPSRSRI